MHVATGQAAPVVDDRERRLARPPRKVALRGEHPVERGIGGRFDQDPHDRAGGLYISILTKPTMGGVAASFALQGDLTLAEPGALIGFAGPRVIEQTIRQKLPDGFQRSEFLLEHGFLDAVVPRKELKTFIANSLDLLLG